MIAMTGSLHGQHGKASSSKDGEKAAPTAQEVMTGMQEAWDASTSLTSDAGLLAQKVLRNQSETVDNHARARKVMDLMMKCTAPAQNLLTFLSCVTEEIDVEKAQVALHECAALFLQLEEEHQRLLEKTTVLSKKEQKLALAKKDNKGKEPKIRTSWPRKSEGSSLIALAQSSLLS